MLVEPSFSCEGRYVGRVTWKDPRNGQLVD